MTTSEQSTREQPASEQSQDEHFDPVAAHPEVAELDYEQARDELTEVVRQLEAGGLSLEESLALWERGEALATVCERHLAGARERVERALASVEEAPEEE
ncbi:exodeoxyribonuclease VII small subunit [Parasphingorhabdus pacifica]